MSRYKAYSAYRDSGIEWVGEIPKSWQVTPLFSVASTGVEKNDDGAESNVLSLSYGRIIRRDVEDNHGLLPESFNTYQIVDSGSIILRLTDLQNDKRSLRVGMANEKGIITSAYLKLTAKVRFLDRYLYRLLHSYDTTKVFYGMGGGLRQSMKFEEMRRLQMLCPSLDEQKQIAEFLDHETAKIDALIEKQQRLIELLKEKRQAVISHAVTKGLNPNAPMKDSGVEWLGEVPVHWIIKPLKFFIAQNKGAVKVGPFGSHLKNSDMDGSDVKIVAQKNVITKNFDIGDAMVSFEKYRELEGFTIFENDVLITTRGTIGRAAVYNSEDVAILHPCLIRLQVDRTQVYPELIALIIEESGYALEQILISSNSTTIEVIYSENLINTIVCVPSSLEEQKLLLQFVQTQKSFFDTAIAKASDAVLLMQERRTALIAAAVTGKIDVRDWQAAA